ncbi:hypothetical protein RUND412_006856 [Rhizina undulata]
MSKPITSASGSPAYAISKLPNKKFSSEARESMNYAVPKKRGPKTEVLEELLKRIDGLEKRLENDKPTPPAAEESPEKSIHMEEDENAYLSPPSDRSENVKRKRVEGEGRGDGAPDKGMVERLLEVYFRRINGKPYSILHEGSFRRELEAGRIPGHLVNAVCAVSVRYAHHNLGARPALEYSEEFAALARSQVDSDEPTLENLQTMLLLSLAFYAMGHGKKCFMQLGSAIRMALALDLHRELPPDNPASPITREIRRRVFWSCYMMDKFTVCGTKRPPLLSDKSIFLRLPSPEDSFLRGAPLEAPFFSDSGQQFGTPNGFAACVDIVRILGKTIRYTQQGGVKGDSHFPWHASSNLSKIKNELNAWASTQDPKLGVPPTPDATALFLGKSIYHLIHCLMYRNFLPIDLHELSGTGTQQAWQSEATKVCFQHANALAELISVASMTPAVEWPAFAGYCLGSAATVFVHGVHYTGSSAFASSKDCLLKILRQLKWMQPTWNSMKQQFATLKKMYLAHTSLLKTYTPEMRFSTVFHLDDFFDRYQGETFEASHVPFSPSSSSSTDDDMNLLFLGDVFPLSLLHLKEIPPPPPPPPGANSNSNSPHTNPKYPTTISSPSQQLPIPTSTPASVSFATTAEDLDYNFSPTPTPIATLDNPGLLASFGAYQGLTFGGGGLFEFSDVAAEEEFAGLPLAGYYGGELELELQEAGQRDMERDPLLCMLAEMAEKEGGEGLEMWIGG